MKEQIKELRVKIDGISQLVKSLHEPLKYLDINSSQNMKVEEMIKLMGTTGITHFAPLEPVSITSSHNELSKCYDSLILAKAWLGKVLGELGEATPYANDGKRKEVGDIEPTADKGNIEDVIYENCIANCSKDYSLLNHIEKIDWLREEIKILLDDYNELENNLEESFPNEVNYSPILWLYYINLCEARFWLGFELGRVRDSK